MKGGVEVGIPSRRRARPEVAQARGSRWSTRRLNDLDPRAWAATPSAPMGRDTRALKRSTTLTPSLETIPE